MLNILLLEDDEYDASLVERQLRDSGFEFEMALARNAEEFVSLLSTTRDLILSDCSIPGLCRGDGLELSKAHCPGVPVILLSGALPEEAVADFLQAGATDFVNKSRLERLPLAIRRALAERDRHVALETAQRELVRAKDAAEQANAAKDHFIATLSHELRTPLTPVMLTLDLMQLEEDLPPALSSSIEIMRRNLELEVQLINDLLDLTAISRGKLQLHRKRVDFREIVTSAVEVCRAEAAEKNVELTVELPADSCTVMIDPRRSQQAVWNLLRNAVKFTPAAGQVHVTCECECDAAGNLVLRVRDTGIGIAPEQIGQIFVPFQQGGNAKRGGLGLGLAIALEIVEAQSGTLVAESEGENAGSTFTMTLPLDTEDGDLRPHPQANKPTQTLTRALRVCLVEDNLDTSALLSDFLRRLGSHVEVANSCADGRRLLSESKFDLLVSDIGLPDGDGYELRRSIQDDGLRSIALTGYGQTADVKRCLDAGFDQHLTKPLEFDTLLAAVQSLFR